jgi:hypothetical protein
VRVEAGLLEEEGAHRDEQEDPRHEELRRNLRGGAHAALNDAVAAVANEIFDPFLNAKGTQAGPRHATAQSWASDDRTDVRAASKTRQADRCGRTACDAIIRDVMRRRFCAANISVPSC